MAKLKIPYSSNEFRMPHRSAKNIQEYLVRDFGTLEKHGLLHALKHQYHLSSVEIRENKWCFIVFNKCTIAATLFPFFRL